MRAIWNSTVLTNALNANFADWEKYAAEWNIVKENRANSIKERERLVIIRQLLWCVELCSILYLSFSSVFETCNTNITQTNSLWSQFALNGQPVQLYRQGCV